MNEQCQRCHKELPGPDPLRRRLTPEEARRFTGDYQPARPVRLVKAGVTTFYCSSNCLYKTFKKPEKAGKPGKPKADSQFHIPPRAA